MAWWWSWLLASIGLYGLWQAGSKKQIGWLIGVGVQVLWVVYAITSRQYGFIAAACGYGFVNTRNYLRWRNEHLFKLIMTGKLQRGHSYYKDDAHLAFKDDDDRSS